MDIKELSGIIKQRRSIFPAQYIEREISDDTILLLIENASWAPNHRKTEPWRFKVFKGAGLHRLSEYLGAKYIEKTKESGYSEIKYRKTIKKPLKCAAVIGICMQRDPLASVPEWEEIAAVACAVQNMWLSCTALGIGSYWSSPSTITGRNQLMDLAEGETCLGLFYMGYWAGESPEAERATIDSKIQWFRD